MIKALINTDPDDIMAAGPTRAALMRRGLVYARKSRVDRFGYLTPAGKELAAKLRAEREIG